MKKKPEAFDPIKALLNAGKIKALLSIGKSKDVDVILFDDGETFMLFAEQDYYSYPDCSSSARHISVYKNAEAWKLYSKSGKPARYMP